MAPREAPTSRRAWLVLVAAALGTCALGGGGLLWAASRVSALFSQATWTPDAVPRGDLQRVFGVSLAVEPLRYTSRNSGYQEPHLEALLLLPPGAEAAFLGGNGLGVSEEAEQDTSEGEDEVLRLTPGAPEVRAVGLDGFRHLQAGDGGFVALYRHGALLHAGTATWVYLVAFGG